MHAESHATQSRDFARWQEFDRAELFRRRASKVFWLSTSRKLISVSVTVSQASTITAEVITCSQEHVDSTDANIVRLQLVWRQYGKKWQIIDRIGLVHVQLHSWVSKAATTRKILLQIAEVMGHWIDAKISPKAYSTGVRFKALIWLIVWGFIRVGLGLI